MKNKLFLALMMILYISTVSGQYIKPRYTYPTGSYIEYSYNYNSPFQNIIYYGHFTNYLDKDSNIQYIAEFDTSKSVLYQTKYQLDKKGNNLLIEERKYKNSNKWYPSRYIKDSFDLNHHFCGTYYMYDYDTSKRFYNTIGSDWIYRYRYDLNNRIIDSFRGTIVNNQIQYQDSSHFEYNILTNKISSITHSRVYSKSSILVDKYDSMVFDTVNNKSYLIYKKYNFGLKKWRSNHILTKIWNGQNYIEQRDSLDINGNRNGYSNKMEFFKDQDTVIYSKNDGGTQFKVYKTKSYKQPKYDPYYRSINNCRNYEYDTLTNSLVLKSGFKSYSINDKFGRIGTILYSSYIDNKYWEIYDSLIFNYDSTYVSAIPNLIIDNPYSISIYPNPAQNQINLNIHSVNNSSKPLIIQIIDNLGNQVQVLQNVKANSTNLIDIQNLSTGMYHLNIFDGTKQVSSKTLMKE